MCYRVVNTYIIDIENALLAAISPVATNLFEDDSFV